MYNLKCQGCIEKGIKDGLYVGETARSVDQRVNEHLIKYETKDKNSVFHKHVEEKHNSERQSILLEIASFCGNDAILRQVTEAVMIKLKNLTQN